MLRFSKPATISASKSTSFHVPLQPTVCTTQASPGSSTGTPSFSLDPHPPSLTVSSMTFPPSLGSPSANPSPSTSTAVSGHSSCLSCPAQGFLLCHSTLPSKESRASAATLTNMASHPKAPPLSFTAPPSFAPTSISSQQTGPAASTPPQASPAPVPAP